MLKIDTGYCNCCRKQVLVQKKGANHILHLLLTLVTSGFWVIIWFACASGGEWRCSQCGSIVKRGSVPPKNVNGKLLICLLTMALSSSCSLIKIPQDYFCEISAIEFDNNKSKDTRKLYNNIVEQVNHRNDLSEYDRNKLKTDFGLDRNLDTKPDAQINTFITNIENKCINSWFAKDSPELNNRLKAMVAKIKSQQVEKEKRDFLKITGGLHVCSTDLDWIVLANRMNFNKKCLYYIEPYGSIQVIQNIKDGVLVSFTDMYIGSQIIFIAHNNITQNLVDGSFTPAGWLQYTGTYHYNNFFGKRTVPSFKYVKFNWSKAKEVLTMYDGSI